MADFKKIFVTMVATFITAFAVIEKLLKGRLNRRSFWPLYLALTIASYLLEMLPSPIRGVSAILFLPALALAVARLHDTGHKWAWILLSMVPYVKYLLVVFFLMESQPEENMWGNSMSLRDVLDSIQ